MRMKKLLSLIVVAVVLVSPLFIGSALAARTSVTAIVAKGPYPGVVNAGDLGMSWNSADNVNGNVWTGNGRDLLIINNPTVGAITITLTSTSDQLGRKGDITAYSVPASGIALFWFGNLVGWAQDAAGSIYLDVSAPGVLFKVIRIP